MLAREDPRSNYFEEKILKDRVWHARIQKIFPGGGVQIPRRGLTENFNMAKTMWQFQGGGGGPPVPPSGSAHVWTVNIIEIICVNKWN